MLAIVSKKNAVARINGLGNLVLLLILILVFYHRNPLIFISLNSYDPFLDFRLLTFDWLQRHKAAFVHPAIYLIPEIWRVAQGFKIRRQFVGHLGCNQHRCHLAGVSPHHHLPQAGYFLPTPGHKFADNQ